ncbi:MAG: hypothetical protein C0514_00020 [Candidatus Puniceispirillum sp.]|nr:hypothetical protein [Candidatus Puniceispirillum sp.]
MFEGAHQGERLTRNPVNFFHKTHTRHFTFVHKCRIILKNNRHITNKGRKTMKTRRIQHILMTTTLLTQATLASDAQDVSLLPLVSASTSTSASSSLPPLSDLDVLKNEIEAIARQLSESKDTLAALQKEHDDLLVAQHLNSTPLEELLTVVHLDASTVENKSLAKATARCLAGRAQGDSASADEKVTPLAFQEDALVSLLKPASSASSSSARSLREVSRDMEEAQERQAELLAHKQDLKDKRDRLVIQNYAATVSEEQRLRASIAYHQKQPVPDQTTLTLLKKHLEALTTPVSTTTSTTPSAQPAPSSSQPASRPAASTAAKPNPSVDLLALLQKIMELRNKQTGKIEESLQRELNTLYQTHIRIPVLEATVIRVVQKFKGEIELNKTNDYKATFAKIKALLES